MPPTQIHFESVKVDQLCSTSSHQGCAAAAVAGQSHTFSTVGIGIFWLMFSQCFFLSLKVYTKVAIMQHALGFSYQIYLG